MVREIERQGQVLPAFFRGSVLQDLSDRQRRGTRANEGAQSTLFTALVLPLVLGAASGRAERRPDPVLVVRPPPTEAAGRLGIPPLPEGSVRLDAVPMPEQELRHTPIPSGYWALIVMAENISPRELPLNPALDRWTVVDTQGFSTPAHPASTLHLGAYLDALPGGMRERVAYPASIRAGARIRFPLFVPDAVGPGIREILFECRHAQAGARLPSHLALPPDHLVPLDGEAPGSMTRLHDGRFREALVAGPEGARAAVAEGAPGGPVPA